MGFVTDICKEHEIRLWAKGSVKVKELFEGKDTLEADGFAFEFEDNKFIVIDEKLEKNERVFVGCHELAHVLFGHIRQDKDTMKDNEFSDELVADVFASMVMAHMMYDEWKEKKKSPAPTKATGENIQLVS